MRAVVCKAGELSVEELAAPSPGHGQVRIGVLRCGICGSDLHARHGCDDWAEMASRSGYEHFARSSQPIVFGHEFCGEILEYGPGTRRRLPPGARVVAVPMLRDPEGVHLTGLSVRAPGAYAEQMLIEESLMMAVPHSVSLELAALTEPLAVAHHAVNRGEVNRRSTAIVIGCGPIGLAVILMLKARGVRTIVASDHSAARRELARGCGADLVVDPSERSPFDGAPPARALTDTPALLELAVGTSERLAPLRGAWSHAWRLGEALGARPPYPVVFECVGAPGVIESIIDQAPMFSRVVVVGVCVGADQFTPAMAINKEIELRFVIAYSPLEFRDTLAMLASGKLDAARMVTGEVGLDGVSSAFDELASPDRHAKILIDPHSRADGVAGRGQAPGRQTG